MDQAVSDFARGNEREEQIAAALGNGVVFLDGDGQIVWIDQVTRERLNGELKDLVLPTENDVSAIDCVVSAVPLAINGEQTVLCVLQETRQSGRDLISAIESVVAETSSFTRTIIEKLRGLRQVAKPAALSSDLDVLTERELDVLGLICEGLSDVEMSKRLNLSHNTVRNHVASLYRKIGVNRRSAAIIWARERAVTSGSAVSVKRRRRGPSESPRP
ncbi:response regulator transcription factor [Bradyrhizobium sp. Arg237L]|uniref:response regulator transcription factor n=1 Tax=Bradyrhizobium sp. Arg237L TaxID=3003352 RepID=UPI00249EFAEA|nr:response regulator transcription factor [Bradyrhizobium sp. Arg237L]MDI4237732.1 response regulator transcription factor [Bradyrhizobium sp. Arg237L]